MSARAASDGGVVDVKQRDRPAPCAAPSCWERVEIVDHGVSEEPVLCDFHRRAYLGVST